MKSTTTYEMHSYAADSAPTVSRSDANGNEEATTIIGNTGCEKYSLRQRHKRRTAAETLNAVISSYLSDDNNNNSEQEYAASGACDATTTTTSRTTKSKSTTSRKRIDNAITTIAATTNNHSANCTTPTKAKTKAAPLSKYRRKTANARERTRMREINSAFENLRHCVPHTITGDEAAQSNEKLTKITTLRLAMKYIHILSEALANPSFEADFLLECKRDGDHRFTTHNWQQPPRIASAAESEFDDQDFELNIEPESKKPPKSRSPASKATSKPPKCAGVAAAKTAKNADRNAAVSLNTAATPRKAPAKRQTKKQKLQQSISPYNSSHSSSSTCSSLSTSYEMHNSVASLSSSATSPPCSSGGASNSSSYLIDSPVNAAYMLNLNHSMSDLSNVNLESDGESLHLSESCLSPPNYVVPRGGASTTTTLLQQAQKQEQQHPLVDVLSPFDQMSSTLENPLELSLRLLDSSADSLDFSGSGCIAADQHAPSSCMSPLVTLDSFNPFSDLLHVDFPEHSALDLFLT